MELEKYGDVRKRAEEEENSDCVEITTRNFILKRPLALNKKLKDTERQHVEIKETGGGLRIILNTGTYELLKVVTEEYFAELSDSRKCKTLQVQDKRGSVIETQYKLSSGKSSLYTLNLYHSTSSCLVNGKRIQMFRETDFPEIIKKIEYKLEINDTNYEKFNDGYRRIIINKDMNVPNTERSESNKRSVLVGIEDTEDLSFSEMSVQNSSIQNPTKRICSDNVQQQVPLRVNVCTSVSKPQQEKAEHCSRFLKQNDTNSENIISGTQSVLTADAACQTDTAAEDIHSKLSELYLHVSTAIKSFCTHVDATNSQISLLKDEVTSIKKSVALGTSQIKDSVNSLSSEHKQTTTETKLALDTMQRRLQSVQDYIKNVSHKPESLKEGTQEKPIQISNKTADQSQLCANELPTCSTENSSNGQSTTVTKQKTLLIGSSIFRGIFKRGLHNDVIIKTLPGRKIADVCSVLQSWDMSSYKNVVIYIGGNDVANNQDLTSSYRLLKQITLHLQKQQCKVYLCKLAPRKDADAVPLNGAVKQICEETAATPVEAYSSFVFGNGESVRQLFHRDGIHLNITGTRALVRAINNAVSITRSQPGNNNNQSHKDNGWFRSPTTSGERRPVYKRCFKCGMTNHETRDCRKNL